MLTETFFFFLTSSYGDNLTNVFAQINKSKARVID